jgi:prophage tail gpP-like protein
MPNPNEVATLIVAGRRFEDFKTVMVEHRWAEAFPRFAFTTADIVEAPPSWEMLQFKPGDACTVYLGGHIAVNGVILTRQSVYAAENHLVRLEGVGITWAAARSSIMDKESKFDNMTFEQIARKVIAPTGVGVDVIGQLDATPFPKGTKNQPGESVWDFLENLARVRGIVLGSTPFGAMLLIGEHNYTAVENLIEGQNVLRMNCIISVAPTRSQFLVRGSSMGGDGHSGPMASEMEASVPGSLSLYSPLLVPSEQPVWNVGELEMRANAERRWNEGERIQATCVVQGWLRAGKALWMAGDKVHVLSPMAMLDMDMKIYSATFSQDEQGTITTLSLCEPSRLLDMDINVGPAPTAKANDQPATTPPAQKVPDPPPATIEPSRPASPQPPFDMPIYQPSG